MWKRMLRTNAKVDLPCGDLARDDVHCLEAGCTLTVDGADGDGVGNARVESSHAGGGRASAGGQDVSNCDVSNESRVDACFGVYGAEHAGEYFFWPRVLESTLLRLRRGVKFRHSEEQDKGCSYLCDGRANCCYDDHIVVVLSESLCLWRRAGQILDALGERRHGVESEGGEGRKREWDERRMRRGRIYGELVRSPDSAISRAADPAHVFSTPHCRASTSFSFPPRSSPGLAPARSTTPTIISLNKSLQVHSALRFL